MKKKRDPWIIKAFLLTFFITILVSGSANYIADTFHFIPLIIMTILIIFIGILFDIIGTSVLIAKEATFHSLASSKIKGSKESINLIKNHSNIASFCNDIVGDVCGIISGSMGAMVAIYISSITKINITITSLLIASVISSLTVGGKAIGKNIATKKADDIIRIIGKLIFQIKYILHIKD